MRDTQHGSRPNLQQREPDGRIVPTPPDVWDKGASTKRCARRKKQNHNSTYTYICMNILSNSSFAMVHWGVLPSCAMIRNADSIYLGVSYTRRQVNVQSIVLVYNSYSYPLVSITNCQQTCGQHGMYCCTECCFYATYGERHTSKTCRVHQLTALLPLDGQLSRTYTPI